MSNITLSIVIPVRNNSISLGRVLAIIDNQTLAPDEVVIVDSSTNDSVKRLIEENKWTVPVVYHFEKKAFPGKARNIGVSMAKSKWIAFLDSKTIPQEDWLERYQHLIQAYHADAVFGVTKFDVNKIGRAHV